MILPIMAKNDVQRLSPIDLVLLAGQVQAGIGDGEANAYGVSKAAVDGLAAATEKLEAANQAVVAAKAAYHAAVAEREAERVVCSESVAGIARTAFANPAVTPAMVLDLGLSPHSTSRTKVIPKAPSMLTATPAANGNVRLAWARSGNAKAVNFIIEARDAAGAWRFVAVTTCASATVEGFAPGMATWFRVTASKNGLTSAPSPVAAIYPAVSMVSSLRMAA